MSRRRKQHFPELPDLLKQYADSRTIELYVYSEYHLRLSDGGYVTLDVWTTGRYYVLHTSYHELNTSNKLIIERGGESGNLPSMKKTRLFEWLDNLFFAAEKESE